MDCYEPEFGSCKKHPNHRQQAGVCSACLRERLSKLAGIRSSFSSSCSYNGTAMEAAAASSCSSSLISPSPPYSSGSSSTYYASPGHRRIASEVMGSVSSMIISGSTTASGLSKSRSVAFPAKTQVGDDVGIRNNNKGGFWSKLIRSTGKRTKVVLLGHSRSMNYSGRKF